MATPQALKDWRAANPDKVKAINYRYELKNADKRKAADKLRDRTAYTAAKYQADKADPVAFAIKNRAAQKAHVAKHPQVQTAHGCAMRARRDRIPYDYRFLRLLPCPTHCPVLGTPISFAYGQGKRPAENTASFDRIVPALGYVPGNVQIISELANRMKADATPEQLKAFAAWVIKTVL
jgi:hypothetical protein